MTRILSLVIFMMISVEAVSSGDDTSSVEYGKRIFYMSSDVYTVDNLSAVFINSGHSEELSKHYAEKLLGIINTDEFANNIGAIYSKHFSKDELKELESLMRSGVFKKFIALRPAIQQDMSIALSAAADKVSK